MTIRQPIVTVAGHIDHGKTTILDSIRETALAAKEAGKITQKISSTLVPAELIKKRCSKLLDYYGIKLEIPGFLFIDTPGHAAFTNLRKRGGSLADLAILVVDINEGIMEQTRESIEVLKASKVPFIVALNKIDAIAGWSKKSEAEDLASNIKSQASFTKKEFEKKLYRFIGDFSALGFNPDLFFRVSDFTKQLALIPCSGKTGEGIAELLVMLAGLAQRFLKGKLVLGNEGKGTILEIKKEKGFTIIEAILYDGILNKSDSLIIASLGKSVETKIRALFEAQPLGKGYKPVEKVTAASGIQLHLPTTGELIPGVPFIATKIKKPEEIEKLKTSLQKEVEQILTLDKDGIIAKAESLGSLEALLFLLRKEGIMVKKAEIGNIKRADIALALANLESAPLEAAIAAFNVTVEPGLDINQQIKVIESDIIYKIVEGLTKWRKEKELEIEREKLEALTMPCRIKTLPHALFRQSKPAIFGVHVEAGLLKAGILLMNGEGVKINKVKAIQSEGKTVDKAEKGKELAISVPNITYGRQIKENEILYSALTENEFRQLKENKKLLSQEEISILQEIAQIKRKEKPTWGI